MSYDPNRIALYLAGRLPPQYKPIDKLYFIEKVQEVCNRKDVDDNDGAKGLAFPDSAFDFIDRQAKSEEQFYSMVLNKVERASKARIAELADALGVPPDATGVSTSKERDKSEVIVSDDSLLKENVSLTEKVRLLTKPLLITEGKTDVKILESAWKKLYGTEPPFDIIENGVERLDGSTPGGNSIGLRNQLNYISAIAKDKVVIGLFDNDESGNEQFKGLDGNIFEPYGIGKDIRKHKTLDIYGFLLPPPKGRESFVHKTDIHQRHIEIEHYFSDEVLDKNKMRGDGLYGGPIFNIANSKDAFSKVIGKLNPVEFENFRIFFERIETYID